jgi:hypothetical protein
MTDTTQLHWLPEGSCDPSPASRGPLPLRSLCSRCARDPSPACLSLDLDHCR